MLGYWDEMHAPLGLRGEPRSSPGRRRVWPALLAASAISGALFWGGAVAWRMPHVQNMVASAGDQWSHPAAERTSGTPSESPAEDLGLRRTAVTDTSAQLAPPVARPAGTQSPHAPVSEPDVTQSRALIINVAEALAAAKLKAGPR